MCSENIFFQVCILYERVKNTIRLRIAIVEQSFQSEGSLRLKQLSLKHLSPLDNFPSSLALLTTLTFCISPHNFLVLVITVTRTNRWVSLSRNTNCNKNLRVWPFPTLSKAHKKLPYTDIKWKVSTALFFHCCLLSNNCVKAKSCLFNA